jgi:hypothetical protein
MTVSAQLADARVPARMIHKGWFWGMRNTAPATTSSPLDRWRAGSGWTSKGLGILAGAERVSPDSVHSGPGQGARDSEAERDLPWQP